jgi:hypothetical protein
MKIIRRQNKLMKIGVKITFKPNDNQRRIVKGRRMMASGQQRPNLFQGR